MTYTREADGFNDLDLAEFDSYLAGMLAKVCAFLATDAPHAGYTSDEWSDMFAELAAKFDAYNAPGPDYFREAQVKAAMTKLGEIFPALWS